MKVSSEDPESKHLGNCKKKKKDRQATRPHSGPTKENVNYSTVKTPKTSLESWWLRLGQ